MLYTEKEWPLDNCIFEELRTQNFYYVDKTAPIWRLANQRIKLFFLGRPRRFGKSLLTTTLRAYFQGKRELFQGLAIEQLEAQKGEQAWQEFPVLHFDMHQGHTSPDDLIKYISDTLTEAENTYNYPNTDPNASIRARFRALIRSLFLSGRKTAILIDEYDSPLAYSLGKEKENDHKLFKSILQGFYSTLKSSHEELRFVLLTGVSQFQQVSVFSGINNIVDITLDPDYATICGMTEEELRANFDWRMQELAKLEELPVEETYTLLKANYDGYRFSEIDAPLFNPFSVICCLAKLKVLAYWFKSGTPYVLRVVLPNTWYNLSELENGVTANADSLLSFNPGSTDPVPILFQAGYLSITGYQRKGNLYSLNFPNKEVRYAFYDDNKTLILGEDYGFLARDAADFAHQVNAGNVRGFMFGLRALLANVPYFTTRKQNPIPEVHFQTALFLVLRLTGKDAMMEVPCEGGRPDIVLYTDRFIYIFEIKVKSTPQVALQQIIDRDYALGHAISGKKVIGIGMNFDPKDCSYTWMAKPKGEEVFGPEEETSL